MNTKQLKAENEELRYQRDRLRAMFATDLMPCGHPIAFRVEENPDEWVCLYCQLAALSWVRWIPVSERLPERDTLVLVYWLGEITLGSYERDERSWYIHVGFVTGVDYWMHLPPAPARDAGARETR